REEQRDGSGVFPIRLAEQSLELSLLHPHGLDVDHGEEGEEEGDEHDGPGRCRHAETHEERPDVERVPRVGVGARGREDHVLLDRPRRPRPDCGAEQREDGAGGERFGGGAGKDEEDRDQHPDGAEPNSLARQVHPVSPHDAMVGMDGQWPHARSSRPLARSAARNAASYSSIILDSVNSSRTRAAPALPIRRRSAGSPASAASAPARAAPSSGGTSTPVTPSSTTSGSPPIAVAMTGL